MASGFLGRDQGKRKIAQLWLGSSASSNAGMVDSASGVRYGNGGGLRLAMTVTAITNTDYPALILPAGAAINSILVYTTTAFTAVTDAQITIGSAAGGAQYVAAVSVKAVGIYTLSFVQSAAAAAAMLAAPAAGLFVRIAQSGGNTAVGAATLVVDFDLA